MQMQEPPYQLIIDKQPYQLWSFDLSNWQPNRDFRLQLTITVAQGLDNSTLLGRPTTLQVKSWSLHGIVTSCQHKFRTPDLQQHGYEITIRSALYPLTLKPRYKIFAKLSVRAIVRTIWQKYNSIDVCLEFKPNQFPPIITREIQYNETDYNFLIRLLNKYSLIYVWHNDKIVITDDFKQLDTITKPTQLNLTLASDYALNSSQAINCQMQQQLQTGSYKLRDYSYLTPELDLVANSKEENSRTSLGEIYSYGNNCLTQQQIETNAKINQQMLSQQRQHLTLTTNRTDLQLGQIIKLTNAPLQRYNGIYRLVKQQISFERTSGQVYGKAQNDAPYVNQLTLISITAEYYPMENLQPKRHGYKTAYITANTTLDNNGYYTIELPTPDNLLTIDQVPLLQPYSGDNSGFHFPLQPKTKVIISFINGNINQPVIMGCLANHNQPNPVSATNNEQNIIASQRHTLCFYDKFQQEKIALFTPGKEYLLEIDNSENNNRVTLSTTKGELHLSCKLNFTETSNNNYLNIKQQHQIYAKQQASMKSHNNISFRSGENAYWRAKREINLTSRGGKILFSSQRQTQGICNNHALFTSSQGNVKLRTNKTLRLTAANNLILTKGRQNSLIIQQSGASITIDAENNITFKANKIKISATQSNLIAKQTVQFD